MARIGFRMVFGVFMALAMVVTASVAEAGAVGYMSTTGEPYGFNGNTAAMNGAFGSGSWNRLNFSTGASALSSSYDFLYLDGSGGSYSTFATFVNSNRTALETYVSNGGKLFINSALPNLTGPLNLGFGVTLTQSVSANGFANGTHPIFDAGTGTSWTGSSFSSGAVSGTGLTTIIKDSLNKSLLAEKNYGSGRVMFGGMTMAFFGQHANWSNTTDELAINILKYGASPLPSPSPVPEPTSIAAWGLGLAAYALRRRRR